MPHGDRSNVVIEPWLTDQWYVDAKRLAVPAIAAVREGAHPASCRRTGREAPIFDWMENIQPWCVSRQLWWGHQIPAWYGPDGHVFVERTVEEAAAAARAHYGAEVALTRDEDVLDTWFSSALWPFSTLGWPDATPELARYYPTSVLVTGFDIIFFWVARMMMMGLHFLDTEPFDTVYIHALVRDEKGAKMSKSKGNVVDPLDLVDEYGADALRFTLAAMAAPGRDIKLATSRIAGYRAFATKLWNASRFAEMNGCRRVDGFDPSACRTTLGRWIVVETARAAAETTAAIEAYRFNDAAGAVYRFVWNTFCDWYLELAKPALAESAGAESAEIRAVTAWALDEIYKLLHPFMPFITEELWAVTAEEGAPRSEPLLVHARWPSLPLTDDPAAREIATLIDLVGAIRSVRAEMNVPAGTQVPLVIVGTDAAAEGRLTRDEPAVRRLARVEAMTFAATPPKGSVQIVLPGMLACLPLAGIVDLAAEKSRLDKELKKVESDVARAEAKLGNADFMARAPEEIVEGEREKRDDGLARRERIIEALGRLAEAAAE